MFDTDLRTPPTDRDGAGREWTGLPDLHRDARPALPPPPAPPEPTGHRSRRGRVVAGAAALVIVAAGAGGAAGWLTARSATDSEAPTTTAAVELVAETGTLDVAGAVDVADDSILAIEVTVRYRQGPFAMEGQGAGTGIVLTADGLVLTNAHVVESAESITVTLPGESDARSAELVAIDPDSDVAVIRVSGVSELVPARFADSDAVRVGDDVIAIGNALNLGATMSVTRGIVSALDREITTDTGTFDGLIQTDAAISSGNSGGALIDGTGAVIGMNSAAAAGSGGVTAENIGFAIPSNRVLDVLADLDVTVE